MMVESTWYLYIDSAKAPTSSPHPTARSRPSRLRDFQPHMHDSTNMKQSSPSPFKIRRRLQNASRSTRHPPDTPHRPPSSAPTGNGMALWLKPPPNLETIPSPLKPRPRRRYKHQKTRLIRFGIGRLPLAEQGHIPTPGKATPVSRSPQIDRDLPFSAGS